MATLINELVMFAVAIMIVMALIVYSAIAVRRIGVSMYIKAIGRFVKVMVGALGTFVASLAELLASSAKTPDSNETTANAARGGILNYRTGKLDDGTDAAGWYEKD